MKLTFLLSILTIIASCGGSSSGGGGSNNQSGQDMCQAGSLCRSEANITNVQSTTSDIIREKILANIEKLSNVKPGLRFFREATCKQDYDWDNVSNSISQKHISEITVLSYDEPTSRLTYHVQVLAKPDTSDESSCFSQVNFREDEHLVDTITYKESDIDDIINDHNNFAVSNYKGQEYFLLSDSGTESSINYSSLIGKSRPPLRR